MQIPGLTIACDLPGVAWKKTNLDGVQWFPVELDVDGVEAVRKEGMTGSREGASDARRGARATGVVLIRMEPGKGYERHRHLGPETVLVLQGGYRDAFGEVRAGDVVTYETGSEHAPIALGGAGDPACVLYAVSVGGIELLER